jgi:hypothetical protein
MDAGAYRATGFDAPDSGGGRTSCSARFVELGWALIQLEKKIQFSFELKEPYPGLCGSENVGSKMGSKTKGETVVKGICVEVTYFLSSRAEESESRTFGVVEVETVNMMQEDNGVEIMMAAASESLIWAHWGLNPGSLNICQVLYHEAMMWWTVCSSLPHSQ